MEDLITIKEGYEYVGFWKRVGATLIDSIILSPIIIFYLKTNKYFIENKMTLPLVLYYFLIYFYDFFFIMKFGGTPGKLLLKIKVVTKDGLLISFKQTFLRHIFFYPSAVNFFLLKFYFTYGTVYDILDIIDSLFALMAVGEVLVIIFNKKKRAIHDILAGSYVVTEESRLRVRDV